MTLAWDDVEASPSQTRTAPKLINDLALVLVDPAGSEQYPWLLDQVAVNATGNPLGNRQQTCGTWIAVERRLEPTLNPHFVAPGDAGNVNDPIRPGDLQPAGFGKDHLNNVEQVLAQPTPGVWKAIVSGFGIAQGPQRYSLVGIPTGCLRGSVGLAAPLYPVGAAIKNLETGEERFILMLHVDAQGRYGLCGLAPGDYEVKLFLAGVVRVTRLSVIGGTR